MIEAFIEEEGEGLTEVIVKIGADGFKPEFGLNCEYSSTELNEGYKVDEDLSVVEIGDPNEESEAEIDERTRETEGDKDVGAIGTFSWIFEKSSSSSSLF